MPDAIRSASFCGSSLRLVSSSSASGWCTDSLKEAAHSFRYLQAFLLDLFTGADIRRKRITSGAVMSSPCAFAGACSQAVQSAFVAQGSDLCSATKSKTLQTSEPPNLQATKVRKLSGLKRELKPMPRAAAKGLAALPILPYHSKLEPQNSIHKSAQIDTNQFVTICGPIMRPAISLMPLSSPKMLI